MGRNIWTKQEEQKLREVYDLYDFEEIENMFPTHKSISSKAHQLGLNRKKYRQNHKKELLKQRIKSFEEIKISKRKLIKQDKTLKENVVYPKPKNPNRKARNDWYTHKEMEFIANNYKAMSDKDIGKKLNRTEKSVQAKRLQMGIKRQGTASYTSLQDFIRANNGKWKLDSMKNCNYKCVISCDRFDDIHHVVGLNIILDEALTNLNYDIADTNIYNACYYSDDELKKMLFEFRRVQSRNPLGVCLRKDIHTDFHNKYGYGNNVLEQWEDFKDNYYRKMS